MRSVKSAKEKLAYLKRETVQSNAADLNVYVVTWNMNGKVRYPWQMSVLFLVSSWSVVPRMIFEGKCNAGSVLCEVQVCMPLFSFSRYPSLNCGACYALL